MKKYFYFIIGGIKYRIEDLGKEMNNHFLNLHQAYLTNTSINFNEFAENSLNFFSDNVDNYVAHDKFFNNFTIIWQSFLAQGIFSRAVDLWNDVLNIAFEWEHLNQKKRIHKGTPYYFLGVTAILKKEIEKGFLLMHQALEEDKLTHKTIKPKTPAYFFVTLDYSQQNQFFRDNVLEVSMFLDQMLAEYRSTRGGSLNIDDFKTRFLDEADLQETVFYYVFTLYRLKKLLLETDSRLTQNIFSSLLMANTLFDFCLVIDKTIQNRNPSKWKLSDHMIFLSQNSSLSLNANKIGETSQRFERDFNSTLKDLIDLNYRFRDGSSLQKIETDLAIVYGFRNFGAHKIEDQPIIIKQFKEISQRIGNALFFTIERLFPSPSGSKSQVTSPTTTTAIEASSKTYSTQDPRLSENASEMNELY